MVTQKNGGDEMSPRTGRPTSDPKNHETRIRMSDEDVRLLEICCEKTGMSKADVIRQGIREVYEKVK
jgi:predicted DNA-binding protein